MTKHAEVRPWPPKHPPPYYLEIVKGNIENGLPYGDTGYTIRTLEEEGVGAQIAVLNRWLLDVQDIGEAIVKAMNEAQTKKTGENDR